MNPNYFTDMVAEIARLSQTPGWKAWARQWAMDLDAEPSGAYKGLVEAVRESLKSSDAVQKNGGSKP
jgi:hypothetical protein